MRCRGIGVEWRLLVGMARRVARSGGGVTPQPSPPARAEDSGVSGAGLILRNMSIWSGDMGNWNGSTPFEVCYADAVTCGVYGGFGGWSLAPKTSLGAGGDSIVLSGMEKAPMAVRAWWRIYPCEALGCGVYTAGEGLPPLPFIVNVTISG